MCDKCVIYTITYPYRIPNLKDTDLRVASWGSETSDIIGVGLRIALSKEDKNSVEMEQNILYQKVLLLVSGTVCSWKVWIYSTYR